MTNQNKKYEFTGEIFKCNAYTLHRIRALRDFGCSEEFKDVKKGDLGGWIESEKNLSHEGDCWVFDEAKVRDDARVYGKAAVKSDAEIRDDARVYDEAKVTGNALIGGETHVCEKATIWGDVKIFGNTKINREARIC